VVRQVEQYADPSSDDHLYVLEFQGIQQQYVMFGRTRSFWRRLAAHRQAADPHGFVLLDGWASPGVRDALPLEQITLGVAGVFHGHVHYRERFYDMSFDLALCIARSVLELNRVHALQRRRTRRTRSLLDLDVSRPRRPAMDLSRFIESTARTPAVEHPHAAWLAGKVGVTAGLRGFPPPPEPGGRRHAGELILTDSRKGGRLWMCLRLTSSRGCCGGLLCG